MPSHVDAHRVAGLYDEVRVMRKSIDALRAERNAVARASRGADRDPSLVERGRALKAALAESARTLSELEARLLVEAGRIPNDTHPDVPDDEPRVMAVVGEKRETPNRDHVELGTTLDWFDFASASAVAGQNFSILRNDAVMFELALTRWAMERVRARGFTPMLVPDMVVSGLSAGCGFQPRDGSDNQVYEVTGTDLVLAGTAEIPLTGMHAGQVLHKSQLPLRSAAFSHSFRQEAGSSGKAVRGLYRLHQFSKVEMMVVCEPNESDDVLMELVGVQHALLGELGLHYRVLDMDARDLGAPAYRKIDMEAWMPGRGSYGEVSSASNCTDYQSRRLGIRYFNLPASDKPEFVHTLNATACAVPRTMIAIMEQFQSDDGQSIRIPEPLRPLLGGRDAFRKK